MSTSMRCAILANLGVQVTHVTARRANPSSRVLEVAGDGPCERALDIEAVAPGAKSKHARDRGIARTALLLAGIAGFSGVALGAFGAHGIKARVAPLPDGEQRLAWWQTGAQYHLLHAIAIGLAAVRPDPAHEGSAIAPWLFVAGIALFSGSLYTMTLTGIRKLGAVTPIGGLCFLAGWAALAWSAFKIID